jgi:hypothetical protein
MVNSYTRDEVHVVTDPSEMALAEVSPADRVFPTQRVPMSERSVADWAARHAIDRHRWFFRDNPIVIQGAGDCGEGQIVERIIKGALDIVSRHN